MMDRKVVQAVAEVKADVRAGRFPNHGAIHRAIWDGAIERVLLAWDEGDQASVLWAPVEDVRRAAKLIGEAVADNAKRETFKGAPVELVLQLGPGFCTRWHIVSGGYLINITGGIAAVMGRKLVERDRRSWLVWRNGYEDLRYHVAEAFGVEISLHII